MKSKNPLLRSSHAEFTLSELCAQTGITPPIMKKYQMLLKLGSGTKKGERTYYSQDQVRIYKRVKELRLAGIEYDEIVELYRLEMKLSTLGHTVYMEEVAVEDDGRPVMLPIDEKVFDLVFDEGSEPEVDGDWRKNKKIAPIIERHIAIKRRITRKVKEVIKALQNLDFDPDYELESRRR